MYNNNDNQFGKRFLEYIENHDFVKANNYFLENKDALVSEIQKNAHNINNKEIKIVDFRSSKKKLLKLKEFFFSESQMFLFNLI